MQPFFNVLFEKFRNEFVQFLHHTDLLKSHFFLDIPVYQLFKQLLLPTDLSRFAHFRSNFVQIL